MPEIDKPPRVVCEHLRECGHGCMIYDARPKMCMDYRCAWLRGHGAIGDQPDKCGVLIDRRMSQFGHVLTAKSFKPGAVRSRRGRNAISRVARDAKMLCLIVDDDDSLKAVGVAGPKALVAQFKHEAAGRALSIGNSMDFAKRLTEQAGEAQWPVM